MRIEVLTRFAKRGELERHESIPLVVRLKIDDWTFPDALDLRELLKSITQVGRYPMFTCAVCHTFGCGGYYVQVEHTAKHYVIDQLIEASDHMLPDSIHYTVPWWQMSKLVKQLRGVIASTPHNHPYLESCITSGLLPSLDMFDDALHLISAKIAYHSR